MAHAQIKHLSGPRTDNFNEFEPLKTGAIGVAGITVAHQKNFLQLNLKGDDLYS